MAEYQGYSIAVEYGRMKKIKSIGKGAIPEALRGLFTTDSEAIKAIDSYLASNPKGKQNGAAEGIS